jgi:hypothetical protein
MNKQPEALRLAAHAEANAFFGDMELIAAELRRLHEVNAELLEALKEISRMETDYANATVKRMGMVARAAIAKAEGEKA